MPTRILGNLPEACFAVVEMGAPAPSLADLVPTIHPALTFTRAEIEPKGYAWYLVLVPGLPIDHQAAVASAALHVLMGLAHDGLLRDFRIVHGDYLVGHVPEPESIVRSTTCGPKSRRGGSRPATRSGRSPR